jgi:aminoglycoside phosphotransferase (APT) family kinase protein
MAEEATAETNAGVDLDRLRPYFAEHVPLAGDKPLSAELIAGGRSNLTYAISNGTGTWVLRRPPLGHVLPTAHDMVREYKVLTALAGTGVPVPRTYALCEDVEVNDAPFYVMEKVDGVIYRDGAALSQLDAKDARRVSEELVDVLAQIGCPRSSSTCSRRSTPSTTRRSASAASGTRTASSSARCGGGASSGSGRRPVSCPRSTRSRAG